MERKENEDGIHLYNAITGGDLELLTRSDSILLSQTTFQKNTILHIAVQLERKECVEIILQRLQPSQTWLLLNRNRDGDTALHIAAKQGLDEIAELLLNHAKRLGDQDIENGGGNETTIIRQLLSITNNQENTALHEALLGRDIRLVKLVTTADPNVEYIANTAGKTPLYLAAEEGLKAAVRLIVRTCPSSHYEGPDGKTAMHAAVMKCDSGVIEVLHGMSRTMIKQADDQGWTPLHYAAFDDRYDIVIGDVVLTLNKSAAYSQDIGGMTPLHVAAGSGSSSLASKIMVECPDCVEVLDHKGRNFLHMAAFRGQTWMVRRALEHTIMNKGLINGVDNEGNTPLHLASISKAYYTVDILCQDARLNKKIRNKKNLTAHGILVEVIYIHFLQDFETRDSMPAVAWKALSQLRLEFEVKPDREVLEKPPPDREDFYEKIKNEKEKKHLELAQKMSDSHLVVAALIATVTFAAGFALPGDYNDDGMPNLLKKTSFRAFIISNTTAMLLSSLAVFVHFIIKLHIDDRELKRIQMLLVTASNSTLVALQAMMFAFVSGTYAVLAKSHGLAVTSRLIGSSFFILGSAVFFIYLLYGNGKKDERHLQNDFNAKDNWIQQG